MDNIILIGSHKTIEILKDGGWVDGEEVGEQSLGTLYGISNPMSYKMLKNFEAGKYTQQDQVFYSKQYLDCQGAYTYMMDKSKKNIKYIVDDIKTWDDSILVKYILKRCTNGQ